MNGFGCAPVKCSAGAMTLRWTLAPQRFSGSECDQIIALSATFAAGVPEVVPGSPGRRLGRAWKLQRNPDTEWVFRRLIDAAWTANSNRFALDIVSMHPAPELVEYAAGNGQFDWHNDYSHEAAHPARKLTVIAQLSDPADYDGGALQVLDNDLQNLPAQRGSIVAFPAFLTHRVTPVTRGLRRALVSWFGGPRLR